MIAGCGSGGDARPAPPPKPTGVDPRIIIAVDARVGYIAPIGLAAYLDSAFIPIRPLTPPLPER